MENASAFLLLMLCLQLLGRFRVAGIILMGLHVYTVGSNKGLAIEHYWKLGFGHCRHQIGQVKSNSFVLNLNQNIQMTLGCFCLKKNKKVFLACLVYSQQTKFQNKHNLVAKSTPNPPNFGFNWHFPQEVMGALWRLAISRYWQKIHEMRRHLVSPSGLCMCIYGDEHTRYVHIQCIYMDTHPILISVMVNFGYQLIN